MVIVVTRHTAQQTNQEHRLSRMYHPPHMLCEMCAQIVSHVFVYHLHIWAHSIEQSRTYYTMHVVSVCRRRRAIEDNAHECDVPLCRTRAHHPRLFTFAWVSVHHCRFRTRFAVRSSGPFIIRVLNSNTIDLDDHPHKRKQ